VLYWQLSELGVRCEVIAPTLVPVKAGVPADRSSSVGWKAGDRVKTDRRDALKLARSYRPVIARRPLRSARQALPQA
jgi:transposase